ncbi:MAG: DUF5305 domain-containing protein [Oscillospiraceae bacterium]|nr:DUF5305 domain-containing protein [Oscillospiraceae bacterium]
MSSKNKKRGSARNKPEINKTDQTPQRSKAKSTPAAIPVISLSGITEKAKSIIANRPYKLKPPVYYTSIALCFVLLLAFMAGTFYCALPRTQVKPTTLYNGKTESRLNYEVAIKPNEFYQGETLPSGVPYISSVVSAINLSYSFKYSGTEAAQALTYYTTAVARLTAYSAKSNEPKVLWEYTDPIYSSGEQSSAGGRDFEGSTTAAIDQDKYAAMIKSFAEKLEVGVSGTLDVEFTTVIRATVDGNLAITKHVHSLSMPVGGEFFEIKLENKKLSNTPIKQDLIVAVPPKTGLAWGSATAALLLLLTLALLLWLSTPYAGEAYEIEQRRMLAEIEDRAVNLSKESAEQFGESIPLKDFESLIRMADECGLPVFCVKEESTKPFTEFFVADGGRRYSFVLKG